MRHRGLMVHFLSVMHGFGPVHATATNRHGSGHLFTEWLHRDGDTEIALSNVPEHHWRVQSIKDGPRCFVDSSCRPLDVGGIRHTRAVLRNTTEGMSRR